MRMNATVTLWVELPELSNDTPPSKSSGKL